MRTLPTSTLLVALALTACGGDPTAPSAPAPAGPAAQANEAETPAGDSPQSRFGLNPTPVPTPGPSAAADAAASTAAGPAASPSPTPVPRPSALVPTTLPAVGWEPSQSGARMVAFASTRVQGAVGGFDVYLYDPPTATVYAIPAANTAGDEINPSLSTNGRWLIFSSNGKGKYSLVRYDLQSQTMLPLDALDTDTPGDKYQPTIDDAGSRLAFMDGYTAGAKLHLFDLETGVGSVPAAIAAMQTVPGSAQLSGDGRWLTFAANKEQHAADVYVYQLGTASVQAPSYINTISDELDPWLSADGNRLLFSSNRNGSFDIFEADLETTYVKDLGAPNSAGNERAPRYMGTTDRDVLFDSDRDFGGNEVMLFHRDTNKVDTLPFEHEDGDPALRGYGTLTPMGSSSSGGSSDYFGFGGMFSRTGTTTDPFPGTFPSRRF